MHDAHVNYLSFVCDVVIDIPATLLLGSGAAEFELTPSRLCRYAYLNPLHYSWGALMINAFEGRNVQISGSEVRSIASAAHLCARKRLILAHALHRAGAKHRCFMNPHETACSLCCMLLMTFSAETMLTGRHLSTAYVLLFLCRRWNTSACPASTSGRTSATNRCSSSVSFSQPGVPCSSFDMTSAEGRMNRVLLCVYLGARICLVPSA